MTPEEFTKHVGDKTFADAVSVTLRTKASDEDTKEWQHDKIKELAKEHDQLRAQVASLTAERDDARTGLEAYATAARVIMLHLAEFCDSNLTPDLDIADAARCAARCLDDRREENRRVIAERNRLMADVVQYRMALETLIAQCDKTDWMGVAGEMDAELDAARAALAAEHPGAPLVEKIAKAVGKAYEYLDRIHKGDPVPADMLANNAKACLKPFLPLDEPSKPS